jgi:hypothetical protein
MKPDSKTGSSIFTAGFIVERTGRNLQGESIYQFVVRGFAPALIACGVDL